MGRLERFFLGYLTGFAIFILGIPYLIYFVSLMFDMPLFVHWSRFIFAGLLLATGLVFMVWSNIELVQRGNGGPTDLFNHPISPRTEHLVTSGPYQYTRNPMALGAICCYMAIAIHLDSIPAMIFVAILAFSLKWYIEEAEERRLWKDFGKEYEEYRKRVPMLLPGLFINKRSRHR